MSMWKTANVMTAHPLRDGAVRILCSLLEPGEQQRDYHLPHVGGVFKIQPNADIWPESPGDAASLYRGALAKVVSINPVLDANDKVFPDKLDVVVDLIEENIENVIGRLDSAKMGDTLVFRFVTRHPPFAMSAFLDLLRLVERSRCLMFNLDPETNAELTEHYNKKLEAKELPGDEIKLVLHRAFIADGDVIFDLHDMLTSPLKGIVLRDVLSPVPA